jgi:uncharacterized membrane protein
MRSSTGFMISGLALGTVFILLGIPLAMGKVKPNDLYGLRIPKTLENPEIWYKANAFAGKALSLCGAFVLILAPVYPYAAERLGLGKSALGTLALAIEVLPILAAAVISFIYTARL